MGREIKKKLISNSKGYHINYRNTKNFIKLNNQICKIFYHQKYVLIFNLLQRLCGSFSRAVFFPLSLSTGLRLLYY